tara:strand:- start:1131 stop:1454 length:324 start_codon:yes stop_codon:yes gene_type:complete
MIVNLCKVTILALIFILSGCALTSNVNLNQGIHSFQVQDYRRAFIKLKPEADKGNPQAQYAIGYMYFYGQGVVEDRKQAIYWIKCAANAGYPDAVMALKLLSRPSKK